MSRTNEADYNAYLKCYDEDKFLKSLRNASMKIQEFKESDYWKLSSNELQKVNNNAPIFRGQKIVIHASAGRGKSTLLTNILKDMKSTKNAYTIAMCIGERLTEVSPFFKMDTDEVFDMSATSSVIRGIKTVEILFKSGFQRALKLAVEKGRDVVLIVDSLSRLAQYMQWTNPNKSSSFDKGGVDPFIVNRIAGIIGAGGTYTSGGSLTVIGTCLLTDQGKIDTGMTAHLKAVSDADIYLNSNHTISSKSMSRQSKLIENKPETQRDPGYNPFFKNGVCPKGWMGMF